MLLLAHTSRPGVVAGALRDLWDHRGNFTSTITGGVFVTAVTVIICPVSKMKGTESRQFGGMKVDLITATESLPSLPSAEAPARLRGPPVNRAASHASKQTSREDRGEIVCQGCVFAREERQYLQEGPR